MVFILGKTLSVLEKIIISGIYVIRGVSIRYGAFIGSWVLLVLLLITCSCLCVLGTDPLHHVIEHFAGWVNLGDQLEDVTDHLPDNILWITHLGSTYVV